MWQVNMIHSLSTSKVDFYVFHYHCPALQRSMFSIDVGFLVLREVFVYLHAGA